MDKKHNAAIKKDPKGYTYVSSKGIRLVRDPQIYVYVNLIFQSYDLRTFPALAGPRILAPVDSMVRTDMSSLFTCTPYEK